MEYFCRLIRLYIKFRPSNLFHWGGADMNKGGSNSLLMFEGGMSGNKTTVAVKLCSDVAVEIRVIDLRYKLWAFLDSDS